MTGTQLLRYQDRKIRFFEDEANSLQSPGQGRNGEEIAVVEQLVADCLRYPEEAERLWQGVRQVITSGAPVDYQVIGEKLQDMFARLIHLLSRLHSFGDEVSQRAGREVERHGELIDALAALRKMETRILSTWPWPNAPFSPVDMAMVEASRRSHDAGESEELDDILARLKTGGDVTQEA